MLVAARAVDLDRDADGLGDVDGAVRPPTGHVQQVARVPGMHARAQRVGKSQGMGRREHERQRERVCVKGWGGREGGREGGRLGEVHYMAISTTSSQVLINIAWLLTDGGGGDTRWQQTRVRRSTENRGK